MEFAKLFNHPELGQILVLKNFDTDKEIYQVQVFFNVDNELIASPSQINFNLTRKAHHSKEEFSLKNDAHVNELVAKADEHTFANEIKSFIKILNEV